jgi:hypothetical protein
MSLSGGTSSTGPDEEGNEETEPDEGREQQGMEVRVLQSVHISVHIP